MRILGAIAVALALALAVAGCGGRKSTQAGPKPVSGDLIVAAASKSARSGSVEADFKISGPGVKGSGSGVFNTGPHVVTMDFNPGDIGYVPRNYGHYV